MIAQRVFFHLTLTCLTLGCVLLLVLLSFDVGGEAPPSSPFGVSAPAAPLPVGGEFLRDKLSWIYQQQAAFYKSLTSAVKDAKTNGSAVWFLVGLSFLYGIFHAAGPGHGKIVISSYVLANEQSAKRGMIISFIAAFMQGMVAVFFIGAAVFLFSFTSFEVTAATRWFEIASYLLIALLGVYLLWQKGARPFLRAGAAAAVSEQPLAVAGDRRVVITQHHQHIHHHVNPQHQPNDLEHGHAHHSHDHDHDHDCNCGGHAVDPHTMTDPLSLRSAWAAIASVGLRPCSGALIVLVFAAAQGLLWVGVVSTFAMALGTAITVTTLATIALGAKGLAAKYLSATGASGVVFKSIEVCGASLVFLLGITLLAASLQG